MALTWYRKNWPVVRDEELDDPAAAAAKAMPTLPKQLENGLYNMSRTMKACIEVKEKLAQKVQFVCPAEATRTILRNLHKRNTCLFFLCFDLLQALKQTSFLGFCFVEKL